MLSWLINPLRHADSAELVSLIRRGTIVVLAILWFFALAAATAGAWLLVTRGVTETQATAVGFEQYARRIIEIGDFVTDDFEHFLTHRGSAEGLEKDTSLPPELYKLNQRLPPGSAILFAMPDGRVSVSTAILPPKPLNLSDRRWFKAHTAEGMRSYIGPAIASRVINGEVFTFSKSYLSAGGQLLGIVVLGIPSSSIISYSHHDEAMKVAIIQHEGPVVAGDRTKSTDLGKRFALPGVPPALEGTVLGNAFGELSIATMRNLPDQGLYVVAAIPLLTVLHPALWSMAYGLPVLILFSVVLLNLSHLAQRKSQQVEKALADNRMLFQEVHHRVKNNLQVISSLLRMQVDRLPEEFRPVLEQTAARVRAIAMVHEQIYSADTPSVIHLEPFLQALLTQLQASLLGGDRAGIVSELEPVKVGLDQAVPVALMATEAITNAIRHGLGCGQGEITVRLRQQDDCNVLQVEDTGTGPPPDSTGGLGTRIMTALARQIDGEWSLERTENGCTRFTLTWPQGMRAPEAEPASAS